MVLIYTKYQSNNTYGNYKLLDHKNYHAIL